jgi:hypothetical protein
MVEPRHLFVTQTPIERRERFAYCVDGIKHCVRPSLDRIQASDRRRLPVRPTRNPERPISGDPEIFEPGLLLGLISRPTTTWRVALRNGVRPSSTSWTYQRVRDRICCRIRESVSTM